MPIKVTCQCNASFNAKDHLAGKLVKCPSCGQPLAIPALAAVGEPAPLAPLSPSPFSDIADIPAAAPSRPVPQYKPGPAPRASTVVRTTKERGFFNGGKMMTGVGMMVGAVIWFVVGLYAGWIFYYPPILFVVGVITFVNGMLGRE